MAEAAVVGTGDKVEVELELSLTKAEHQPEPADIVQECPEDKALVFTPLTDTLTLSIRSACALMPPAEVTVSPPGCVLPENFCNYAKRIKDLTVYEDDIWIISFPKCGAPENPKLLWEMFKEDLAEDFIFKAQQSGTGTEVAIKRAYRIIANKLNTEATEGAQLTQEMVWLLRNNQDYEQARNTPLYKRFVLLEYIALWPEGADQPDTVSWVEDMPRPRYIKSHLPLELLPTHLWTKKPKIIYVGRNPKDTALDYFTHYQTFYQFSGSQELFFDAFYHDRVVYGPFWEHVLGFWSKRKEPHLFINTYEEMSQNLKTVLKKISLFLGITLESEAEKKLLHYLEHNKVLDGTKNGDSEDERNIKKLGKAGSWRTSMTPSYVEKFDRWTKEKLAGTDFSNVFMII